MLDNLQGVDLSGLRTYISYDYTNIGTQVSALLIGAAIFVFLVLIAIALHRLITGSKTKQHRELLEDMYVSGRIKQLAKEDSIDIEHELKEYALMTKRMKMEEKALHNVVADELKLKVAGLDQDKDSKKK